MAFGNPDSAGGGGGSVDGLLGAYQAASTVFQNQIQTTSALGKVLILDASSTIGTIFAVQTFGGEDILRVSGSAGQRFAYAGANGAVTGLLISSSNALTNTSAFPLKVDAGGATTLLAIGAKTTHAITSDMADGASALALAVDTSSTWSTSGGKLLSVRNNGTEKMSLTLAGLLTLASDINFNKEANKTIKVLASTTTGANGGWLFIRGADGAAGDGSTKAGIGGDVRIFGGNAGTAGLGGGDEGGEILCDAGSPTGASSGPSIGGTFFGAAVSPFAFIGHSAAPVSVITFNGSISQSNGSFTLNGNAASTIATTGNTIDIAINAGRNVNITALGGTNTISLTGTTITLGSDAATKTLGLGAQISSSAMTFTEDTDHTISIAARASNAFGKNLNIASGNATGAGNVGGNLVLNSGTGALASGDINIGSTSSGDVNIRSIQGLMTLRALGTNSSGGRAFVIKSDTTLTAISAAVVELNNNGNKRYLSMTSGTTGTFMCDGEDMTASAAIAVGDVVVWSGSGKVATAAATVNLTTIAGVALTAAAANNDVIRVATWGRCLVNSVAGVTAGSLVGTSGVTAGSVQQATVPGAGAILGRAVEATSDTVANKVCVFLTLG